MYYLIMNVSEIDKINFDEIIQTSIESMRISLDGTKTIVKWDEESPTPTFISTLTWSEGPYVQDEILPVVRGSDWTKF